MNDGLRHPAPPRSISTEEFLRNYVDPYGYELVRGQLLTLPMTGVDHSFVLANTASAIYNHVKPHDLGHVCCGGTLMRLFSNPDTYRAADVTFASYDLLPKGSDLPEGPLEMPATLVAEVFADVDPPEYREEKINDYLNSGMRAVLVIDLEEEFVAIHRVEGVIQRFHNGDTVTLPDVLPGFAAPVKAFFE